MNSKVYVGNMPFQTTEAGLRELFGQFGCVTDVLIISEHDTGRPRGFGFVTFATEAESALAIERLHGAEIEGSKLTVNQARTRDEPGAERKFSSPNRRPGAFYSRQKRRR